MLLPGTIFLDSLSHTQENVIMTLVNLLLQRMKFCTVSVDSGGILFIS